MNAARPESRRNPTSPARVVGSLLVTGGVVLLTLAAYALDRPTVTPGPLMAAGGPEATVAAASPARRLGGQHEPSTVRLDALAQTNPVAAGVTNGAGLEHLPGEARPPIRLELPTAGVDTPVVEVQSRLVRVDGREVREWDVADYAAGHHAGSAIPGESGNVVIAGHSDVRGAVFGNLAALQVGDPVVVTTADQQTHRYVVVEVHYRKEAGMPLEERLATGQFIEPTEDERVTLVSCWPPLVDDHRLIVVAKPARP